VRGRKVFRSPSISHQWCDTAIWAARSYSSTPTCSGVPAKTDRLSPGGSRCRCGT
jgi:hypothetical protein